MTHRCSSFASSGARAPILACAVALSVLLVGSCSPTPDVGEPVTAAGTDRTNAPSVAPAATTRPVAVLPDGFEVKLELAVTPEELAQGLMYRPRLADATTLTGWSVKPVLWVDLFAARAGLKGADNGFGFVGVSFFVWAVEYQRRGGPLRTDGAAHVGIRREAGRLP